MNQPFSLLPFMPFDPAWIEQGEAFRHPDPRMLKAAMKLLFAAWRGAPVGSIPSSHSYIAEVTGLAPELVGERYIALTDGFELREDGRLHHTSLAQICYKMTEGYGPEIEAYTVALAMVAQDPEQFSLMSVEAGKAGARVRGKHLVPKGFGFETHPELRPWCVENGYPAPNQQRYIMEGYIDWAVKRSEKYKDHAAGFRSYARGELGYNKLPPPPEWPEGHPGVSGGPRSPGPSGIPPKNSFAGLQRSRSTMPTRGEQALDHNRSVMDAAFAGARAPAQRG